MAGKFTFVNSSSVEEPVRAKELRKSEALSHAARVAHQRLARNRQPPGQKPSVVETTPIKPATTQKTSQIFVWQNVPSKASNRVKPRKSMIKQECDCFDDNEDDFNHPSHKSKAQLAMWNELDAPNRLRSRKSSIPGVQPALTEDIDRITSMFWQVTFPSAEHFCKLYRTKNIFTQDFLNLVAADDAFFHLGAAFVKYEYNEIVDSSDKTSSEVLAHKVKTLEIIQQRLKRSGGVLDNVTLAAIMLLPFVEDLSSSMEVSQTHWTAVSRIFARSVKHRSIEDSPHAEYCRLVMDQVSSFCFFHTGININEIAPTPEDSPSSSPEPTRAAKMQQAQTSGMEFVDALVFDRLPHGIKALLSQGAVGSSTVKIASQMDKCLSPNFRDYYYRPDGKPTSEGMTASFIKNWGLYDMKPTSVEGEPSIEELLPAAIMVYSARAIGQLSITNSTSRAGRAHLSIRLPQCVTPRRRDEEYALFWIWTVTVESWQTRLVDLPSEGIKMRDKQVVRFPWALSAEVSQRALKLFYWDDKFLQNHEKFLGRYWM